MQKIKNTELKEIKGRAVLGAFLNRIGSIIGKAGDFIIDVAMVPFAYIEAAKGHDKAKFKIGGSTFEFDNTNSVKLKANNDFADNVIKLDSMKSIDNKVIITNDNVDVTQLLNANDSNITKDIVFNKFFG